MGAHHRHRAGQSLGKLVSGRCLCPGCGQAQPPHPHSSGEGLGASASCRKGPFILIHSLPFALSHTPGTQEKTLTILRQKGSGSLVT